MDSKDYYEILGIKPLASAKEIKHVYRKLALKYHPDKNNDDKIAESVFKEINEAYDVLSDPEKRNEYTRKRFGQNGNCYHAKGKQHSLVTSNIILQQSIELRKLVSNMNVFGLNQDALLFRMKNILSNYHLQVLVSENDGKIIKQIVSQLLKASQPLNYSYVNIIALKLIKLAGSDTECVKSINVFVKKKKWQNWWQHAKIPVAILLTIILCIIIFSVSV